MGASLDGYRSMDNACSGFGVGEHAGVGQLKRKHEKGYSKTMSLIENEQRHKLLHKISDVSRGMNGPYGLRNITCHMVEKKSECEYDDAVP
jgi:hypothetical protein